MKDLAIVTGGTSGIGKALVEKLASQGITVITVGRDDERLAALSDSEFAENIIAIKADITKESHLGRILEQIASLMSTHHLTLLIHNATTLLPIKAITDVTGDEARVQMDVNYTGPMLLTNQVTKYLYKGARILFLSTGAAETAIPKIVPHCAAKAAQLILAAGYKDTFKSKDIFVGIVRPGMVDTPAQEFVRSFSEDELPFSSISKETHSSGKLITPSDCADLLFALLRSTDSEIYSATWPWSLSNEEHLVTLRQMIKRDSERSVISLTK
ncbi:MAG: SDR family oxidoreductase [Legionellales bacterium]|nr:SDR family oxidoreductase [Legionellales bacterium]